VQRIARATLPPTITTSSSGTAQVFQDSQRGLLLLLLLAVLVTTSCWGSCRELHPPADDLSGCRSRGLARPDASSSSDGAQHLRRSWIIMLVGLVEEERHHDDRLRARAERKEGKPPREAIVEGVPHRFRPIMMTTMPRSWAPLPIAVASEPAAEARRPLGLAVVGGLLVSQLITLYVTPVIYTYLDAFSKRFSRKSRPAASETGGGAGDIPPSRVEATCYDPGSTAPSPIGFRGLDGIPARASSVTMPSSPPGSGWDGRRVSRDGHPPSRASRLKFLPPGLSRIRGAPPLPARARAAPPSTIRTPPCCTRSAPTGTTSSSAMEYVPGVTLRELLESGVRYRGATWWR